MIDSAPAQVTAEESEPRIIYLVKRIEMIARAHLDGVTREQGLTTLQYTALSVLRAQPGLSAAQLARRSFVSPQAMTEMVGALEAKGMIRREPDPGNRRVLRAYLTDTSRTALHACDRGADLLEEHMLGGVSAQERAALRRTLAACAAELDTFAGAPAAPT
ncbi:MarR family winged helix-turn-helix transcriptional regulator [Streptomonospora salina]|uniref:DNA-binding MarR family transcriptional regulator n=1 Tax=Streptomonospora salina TaxID=104205 RepID=A0A841E3F3_9ACTN|nr:MarR family transcriptional regulator [Streptomonospora salina]MBB5997566.1 DNA-binding MarR family transcriptional regulator [Streptomonospora salina]